MTVNRKSVNEAKNLGVQSTESQATQELSADPPTRGNKFVTGNEFVIALTKHQYLSEKEYWEAKAQEQANARRQDVLIITEDTTPFRAKPDTSEQKG